MRIKSVRIINFRCLQDVRVEMDTLTAFIGPNGAGKSTVLRALDWFFNGEPKLTDDDVYSGADPKNRRISVEVTFNDLSDTDRGILGPKYAPPGSTSFTAWRTWLDGQDKMTGRAKSFPPFEEIRAATGVKGKKPLWEALLDKEPDIGLPKWPTLESAEQAMTRWEQDHPERLEDTESGVTHLFGFNGQHKLSGLFDYVLVTADLRAGEESVEGKKTIVGRILERAIDRDSANVAFAELAKEVSNLQAEITDTHLGSQLAELGAALTAEVTAFAAGRGVRLQVTTPDVRPSPASISVLISDALVETSVDRQGHGFQRALLISALKLLAARGAQGTDGSVICLAIEEPELFQHPAQARVFAKVLRDLSSDAEGGLQVVYATHSPYFIEPRYFDQVRRVSRRQGDPTAHPRVDIYQASLHAVVTRLAGYCSTDAIRQRWDQVCTRSLAEAFFAEAVVLVEGDNDKSILDGIASREGQRQFEVDGITVAQAHGKQHLYTPHAILAELGIPTLVVFDNDSGCGARVRTKMANGGRGKAEAEERNAANTNRALLRYFGEAEQDFPVGAIGKYVFVWDDMLETVLYREWASWEKTRVDLIDSGRGVDGKNSATYALAALSCPDEPAGMILDAVKAARALIAVNGSI
ncbi:ATP-dependent endonuclease [Rhodococcus sp. PSBB049]|uniref:ATP-dependent nuclease n=1 Tax=Rhodococcus sp. PSBB049 TaxID=2812863 RepID=UPI00197E8F74|nr:ATP-dependent endonuclease [Rhodococcus sp. PSBB049]QSE72503.1 ATP-dependent endonuclease [Rhodococcus sp. PSBB049]